MTSFSESVEQRPSQDNEIGERTMTVDLDAGLRQAPDQEQSEDAARKIDARDNSFDRHDFRMLMISIAILVFGMWWVAPR